MACVGSAVRFQPVMSPPSLSKMNAAGPVPPGPVTANWPVPLNTCPVGAPPGMDTTNGEFATGAPATPPGYRVAVLVPLLATQTGLVALSARPHELTAFGSSTFGCSLGSSETWLTWVTRGAAASSACAGAAP